MGKQSYPLLLLGGGGATGTAVGRTENKHINSWVNLHEHHVGDAGVLGLGCVLTDKETCLILATGKLSKVPA